jgi:predicted permease
VVVPLSLAAESLWADARYALRQLLKSPGITLVAIATLALGIGANTAIFTLTWNILLTSLPVPHPERLVEYEMRDGDHMLGLSGPEYTILRRRQQSCIDLLAWSSSPGVTVRDAAGSERLHVQLLTANAFRVLEMQPLLGRFFSEDDAAATSVPAVLSYDEWQRRYHGDERALGQTLFVEGHAVTVAGVMPRAFEGLTANLHPALYLPYSFAPVLYEDKDYWTQPGHLANFVLGRLKPGATLAQARAEVSAVEPSLRKEADPSGVYLGQFFKNFGLQVRDGRSGVSYMKMTYQRPLLVLELLVCFLLVLCALNTALVMLARVSGRQQEYALRAALGARRFRLIRQVLVETLLLALPGLAAGIGLGWLGARALVASLGDRGTPQPAEFHPNAAILAVNIAATLLVALAAGLLPAVRAAGVAPALDLKAADRSVAARRLLGFQGGWVIALQVAVSLCLVSTALLLGGTLGRLLAASSGFRFEGAAVATVDLSGLKLTEAQNAAVFSRLNDALQSRPGVTAVGFTALLPLTGHYGISRAFSLDSHHIVHSDSTMFYGSVSPQYFAAAGTTMVSGGNTAAAPGATDNCVLSQSLARFFFPGESAIRNTVYFSTLGKPDGAVLDPKASCRVVGIAEDAKYVSLREPAPTILYQLFRPEAQHDSETELIVRAGSDALALAALREAIAQTVPPGSVVTTRTFIQHMHGDLSRERMLVGLSSSFGLLALLLTALGLYGLVMRSVTLRTREIGIRVALGAQRRSILIALGRRTFLEVALGLLAGTAVALLVGSAIRRLLGIHDAFAATGYLLAAALTLLVAAIAVLGPARKAVRVDPIKALRAE